jgi:hypothetical protein
MNGMFGRKHSPETLEKMRQARIGKKASAETKEKMRVAHLGQKRTDEQRKTIQTVKKLMWQDPVYKSKMHTAGFGVSRKKDQVQ